MPVSSGTKAIVEDRGKDVDNGGEENESDEEHYVLFEDKIADVM